MTLDADVVLMVAGLRIMRDFKISSLIGNVCSFNVKELYLLKKPFQFFFQLRTSYCLIRNFDTSSPMLIEVNSNKFSCDSGSSSLSRVSDCKWHRESSLTKLIGFDQITC